MTDPTPAEALKACPFCGGAAIIWGTSSTSIQCTNDQCIIGESAPFNDFSHRADAIAAWNKRPDAGGVRTYREGVESEWQEIETAPKDGTEIDLFGGVSWKGGTPNRVPNCAWKHLENGPDWHTRGDKGWEPLGAIGWEPTHWRALPAPPAFERTLNRSARGGGSEARHLDANIEKWPWLEHDDD